MPQPKQEKTVFISYRRKATPYAARAIYEYLKSHGYDVFMDVESINSGDFERIIMGQIAARAHFLILLAAGSLEGIDKPDDWLRRETEFALDKDRNVIPVLLNNFYMEEGEKHFTGKLVKLMKLNGIVIPVNYWDAAMERLCTGFLKKPLYIEIEEPTAELQQVARQKLEEMERKKAPTDKELTAEEWYNRGYELQNNQKYEEAISAYSEAIILNPIYTLSYINRGVSYGKQGNHLRAKVNFDKAIQLSPNHANAYYNRGTAFKNLKHIDKAIADYNAAIQLDPDFALAYNARGNSFQIQKRYHKAIEDYNKAIQLEPESSKAYFNRGTSSAHLKLYDNSIADFNKIIQLDPSIASAYIGRGWIFQKQKKYQQAIADFTKALSLDPNSKLAKENLERAQKALKNA